MIPSAANGEYCTTNESGADIAISITHGFANGVDLVMAWNAIILSGVLGFFEPKFKHKNWKINCSIDNEQEFHDMDHR